MGCCIFLYTCGENGPVAVSYTPPTTAPRRLQAPWLISAGDVSWVTTAPSRPQAHWLISAGGAAWPTRTHVTILYPLKLSTMLLNLFHLPKQGDRRKYLLFPEKSLQNGL